MHFNYIDYTIFAKFATFAHIFKTPLANLKNIACITTQGIMYISIYANVTFH